MGRLADALRPSEFTAALLAAAEARFRLSGSRRSGRAQRHWPVRTPGGGYRIAIASYLGRGDSFGTSILDFSVAYADQNERDYESPVKAVTSPRLLGEPVYKAFLWRLRRLRTQGLMVPVCIRPPVRPRSASSEWSENPRILMPGVRTAYGEGRCGIGVFFGPALSLPNR